METTLTRRLTRPFTALVLAASLVLTPVATSPARADNEDVAAFLAALIAMGVIGAAVNNNRTVRPDGRAVQPDADYGRQTNWSRKKALPEYCLKTFNTRFGKETLFEKDCLRANYRRWRGLPDACEFTIRTRGRHNRRGAQEVYEPRCLHREGYTLARRR